MTGAITDMAGFFSFMVSVGRFSQKKIGAVELICGFSAGTKISLVGKLCLLLFLKRCSLLR